MHKVERLAATTISVIFALRLLGLFMIYPVFTAYARGLRGASVEMIGLALGAYGLTQGLLQIPFGILSDRIGRKIMITIGLILFAIGSVVAARAGSVQGVLVGRILQGGGAVGSVLLALLADLTRVEVRTRAMASVGITIGFAFVIAIVIGPGLAALIGVSGIFWLTAVLALLGIVVVLALVPRPSTTNAHTSIKAVPASFLRILSNRELLRLDLGIFALHAILTASFLALPDLLTRLFHLTADHSVIVYLPVLVASVVVMIPTVIVAEKGERMKEVFLVTIAVLLASILALILGETSTIAVIIAMIAFFSAFNVMEAMLPSLVTRFAPSEAKGTATGVYSSLQFFGIFVGGAVGGVAASLGGSHGVFIFAAIVAFLWLVVAVAMQQPAARANAT